MVFIGVSSGKAGQGRVTSLVLTGLKSLGRLWAIGVVFSCLVPGLGMTEVKKYCLLWHMVYISKALL
jgi:hypothetical protein